MSRAENSGMDDGNLVSLCSLRAGSAWYGIEITAVREVLAAITPQRVPLAPEFIAGIAPYRGEVLTTVSFRVLLGLERNAGSGTVVVLDDGDSGGAVWAMVDGMGGVVSVARNELEPNPSTLDPRSLALFDGAYRTQSGLIVRLDPAGLSPARLTASRLFGAATLSGRGGTR